MPEINGGTFSVASENYLACIRIDPSLESRGRMPELV